VEARRVVSTKNGRHLFPWCGLLFAVCPQCLGDMGRVLPPQE
jgi:hypothetical protein